MAFDRDIEAFIRDFAKEIEEYNATVFVGAGLSVGSGHVDWRELLKPVAGDLGLDIDRERDLVALAQYHRNEEGNRAKLNRILIDEFARDAQLSENHHLLARLPISVYWTTNYDKLIEKALEKAGKRPDVKHADSQLAFTRPGRDAVVYKMHGDIDHPDQAVLIKDDYEKYHQARQLFLTALGGDLVSKTFLFLGFSFSDPNLDYILSRVRVSLGENVRGHYALLRRVQRSAAEDDADYQYLLRRQELLIGDLKRFGIKALLIDRHEQITEILRRLHDMHRRKSVLVSGAAHDYGRWSAQDAEAFVHQIGNRLASGGFRLVSGFGLGIGSAVIAGALERVFCEPSLTVSDQMVLRPFPQTQPNGMTLDEMNTAYREELVSNAGIVVFVFGNKLEGGETVNAPGVEEEFDLAHGQGLALVPVGATGYMAKVLWDRVMKDFDEFFPDNRELRTPFKVLGDDSADDGQLLSALMQILKSLSTKA